MPLTKTEHRWRFQAWEELVGPKARSISVEERISPLRCEMTNEDVSLKSAPPAPTGITYAEAMSDVVHRNNEQMTNPEPGLKRQVMSYTPEMMLVRHTMEPGWVGAAHSHPHQQLVFVISGHIVLTTPDGDHTLRAGDSLIVPGDAVHQARAFEASEVLDVFTPYREDYA